MPDQDREQELADLLREVRELRTSIEELKAAGGTSARSGYAVLAHSGELRLPPGYAVLARTEAPLLRDYAVLVRAQLPIERVVVNPLVDVPSYEVLVRPVGPPGEEPVAER